MSVTLRRWSDRTSALQAARDLYAANNPKWLRDVESHHDKRAYETLLVLNLPAINEMVDRHGFAPCSPACKAGDLLNDRAAQELKMARRLGAAPSPLKFWRLCCAKLAPAVLLKSGAVSRNRTGIA